MIISNGFLYLLPIRVFDASGLSLNSRRKIHNESNKGAKEFLFQ